MKRFVLAAVVAVAMTLAGGQSARASGCGFATVPGHIGISGGIGLSWGSFGASCFNGGSSGCGGYGQSGCDSGYGGYGQPGCGFATVPGYINLNGSLNLSWGAFGFQSGQGGYSQSCYPMGYGSGHGHGYGHGYGYGYPGYYGY